MNKLETARHVFTVLICMNDEREALLEMDKDEEAAKKTEEAVEYLESWKEEAIYEDRRIETGRIQD